MKLELKLKHLAPYLPYSLKMHCLEDKTKHTLTISHQTFDLKSVGLYPILKNEFIKSFKPILRPLSDLTKRDAVEHGYTDQYHLERSLLSGHAPYNVWIEYIKEHFDLFGLIEQGLAIDVNTLEK